MEGVLWAAAAGVAFGLFQGSNRRGGLSVDPYLATFVLLLVSAVGLWAVTVATQDLAPATAAPGRAFVWFALAGLVHYLLGWTLLALGQQRVGAARTGVLAGTAPLFGTALAFVVLGESVRLSALIGVVLVVAGIVPLSLSGGVGGLRPPGRPRERGGAPPPSSAGLAFGLLTALCWASSPVFIRWGLELLPSPLIGVTIGMTTTVGAYAVALVLRGRRGRSRLPRGAAGWLVLAGALVAFGTAGQWIALDLAPVAVVLALNQLAVPVVVLTAPLIVGAESEPFSPTTALGGLVVLTGTLVIIWSRGVPGA